ncbi:MAG: tRNA preQ1(34) S-adenosylmethionine ribosyltransferase-isomerase QueA [Firmicutes bacterium]|nr:tRNA preQ1(34) S-adenosylmethionine ribosyltransferase-isomerase QueA [Bacillota bacterium]
MKISDFDYELPEEKIAQVPIEPRDHAKLMVVHSHTGELEHRRFYDLIDYLMPNDLLVLNETRVIPARLYGERVGTGAQLEVLLLRPFSDKQWEVLIKPGRRAKVGTRIKFGDQLQATVVKTTDVGGRILEFEYEGDFDAILEELGETPLPPYITAKLNDRERYQTVYAREKGSVAAPTAGLHFTEELLDKIKSKGIKLATVTLHVGLGTFRPIQVETVEEHQMHEEYYCLTGESAALINQCKAEGGRIFAIGTTTVRVLETLAENGRIRPGSGWTDIFIYPGYNFHIVDALVTNFHLPKSSLLLLVSAFANRTVIRTAYQEALKLDYRFFSFGDAMLILRGNSNGNQV